MKVFVAAGAYKPKNEIYLKDAQNLGRLIAENNFTYVQGGCSKGLMGATYNEFLLISDEVELIIPEVYKSDVEDMPCKKLHLVETINQRLKLITKICDYIITIPGGFGTIDEITNFVETFRSKEHKAKLVLININGFYDDYINQINKMVDEGFVLPNIFTEIVKIVNNSNEAIKYILEDIKNSK